MVEIMKMKHKSENATSLITGLVFGPLGYGILIKKKIVEDTHILSCNVSFDYEKAEMNSGFFFSF